MAKKTAVRIGIIGCGGLGTNHCRHYLALRGVKVLAVADVVASQAEALAEEAHAQVYTDWRKMLKDESLDGVSVCTPPAYHAGPAIAALKRGINVMCEKPLSGKVSETRRIVKAVEESDAVLMTAFCHRFHREIIALKRAITSGKLGRLLFFRNRFSCSLDMTKKWFSKKEPAQGGVLLDTCCHSIDMFRFLCGDVAKVAAQFPPQTQRMEVEDSAVLMLTAANGAVGIIEGSWSSPPGYFGVEVYGTKAQALYDYASPPTIRGGDGRVKDLPVSGEPDRFAGEIKHFISCVRSGKTPSISELDGHAATCVVDAAYRSARTGRIITLA